MNRARLLLLGGLLIVGLGLLASSLAGVQFRGGRFPEHPEHNGQPGGAIAIGDPELVINVLVGVLLLATAVSVGLLLSRRQGRRTLLRLIVVLVAMIALLSLIGEQVQRPERTTAELEPGPPAVLPWSGSGNVPASDAGEAAAAPGLPDWVSYAAAGVLTAALAWWAWRRFRPQPDAEKDGVRDALEDAAADLAAGLPVSDVVIRCWAQMVAVLTRRVTEVASPALTPRELADRLVRLGFREEAVGVLTQLFEEVRYGHKDSEPRRGEALAALAAVERAYG